jgi:hypothetical protein
VIERPLLMSAPMVRALLDRRKTQTRRLGNRYLKWKRGDRVWVRETWTKHPDGDGLVYRATDPAWDDECTGLRWKPSIFMPRAASRILLELTADVRQEPLQEITPEDCEAEGITDWCRVLNPEDDQPERALAEAKRIAYSSLWDSINTKPGTRWEDNPTVGVIEFRMVEQKAKAAE